MTLLECKHLSKRFGKRTVLSDIESMRAYDMLAKLKINPSDKLKTMSKGTKEKVQLILVMSRRADLYILDEPIAGVDPAARDYILDMIYRIMMKMPLF